MIQYIIESIAFQFVFIVTYDVFLRRETFFQWNRVYLIGSYIISLVLPAIKIGAFSTALPDHFIAYPEYLWYSNMPEILVTNSQPNWFATIPLEQKVLYGGILVAFVIFMYKLNQIRTLRKKGEVHYFEKYTRVIISKSATAFSFFKTIFLGDQIREEHHESIIKHELVHITQKHTYDLLFFELMRIINWFNPLVYVYQKRISELHEFIADSKVEQTHKKEQYQLLLSQVFQTENISFINHFFKSSIIKKRIVMLQKQKSKQRYRLKYLVLIPLIVSMLFYTSSAQEIEDMAQMEFQQEEDAVLIQELNREIETEGKKANSLHVNTIKSLGEDKIWNKRVFFKNLLLIGRDAKNHKVIFGDDVEPIEIKQVPLPSSKLYEQYVDRENSFKVLDKNLNISLPRDRFYVELISPSIGLSNNFYEFKVESLKKLSANEIRLLNAKIEEVFKTKSFKNRLILTDGKTAIQTYRIKNIFDESKLQQRKPAVPFGVVDKVPVFPGCENEENRRACFNKMMQKHISKNFRYPLKAQELGIQGRVNLIFTILENGKIADLRMRGPHKLLEDEAERIISKLPKMTPGMHKGKNVNVPFSIPITFKLSTDDVANQEPKGISISNNTLNLKIEDYPLIMLEGKEISKEEMEEVDTSKIESINVLKNEKATEKYGAKGKNGVIQITLKKE